MNEISDYDRAISAYQFQIERYHTWMNYYSLFHGALLVALYSLENCKNDNLPLIICLLGYIAGLCWLGTVIGNAKWINRWLEIIKESKNSSIYEKSGKDIEKEKAFLSTQKIMKFFVLFVCFAWITSAVTLNPYSLIFIGVTLVFSIWIYECTSWIHS